MNIISNNKGITLVESLIAVFLTAIAVISLMPMQSTALRAASRADYLGRAEGILQSELEFRENEIMRTAVAPTLGDDNKTLYISGVAGGVGNANGDATFYVKTNTKVNPNISNSWIVNVTVTWQGNATGITSSIIATHQKGFQ